MDEVLEFIKRRFRVDCSWTSGNCYYFAAILKERFGGEVYYDLIEGHFLVNIGGRYYDFRGEYAADENKLAKWADFRLDEPGRYGRILEDCCK